MNRCIGGERRESYGLSKVSHTGEFERGLMQPVEVHQVVPLKVSRIHCISWLLREMVLVAKLSRRVTDDKVAEIRCHGGFQQRLADGAAPSRALMEEDKWFVGADGVYRFPNVIAWIDFEVVHYLQYAIAMTAASVVHHRMVSW